MNKGEQLAIFCETETRRVVWRFSVDSGIGLLDCSFYPNESFAPGLASMLEMSGLPLRFPANNKDDSTTLFVEKLLLEKITRKLKGELGVAVNDLMHQIYAETWAELNGKTFFIEGPNPNRDYLEGRGKKKDLVGFLVKCSVAYSEARAAVPGKVVTKEDMAGYWLTQDGSTRAVNTETIDDHLRRYDLKWKDVLEFCNSSHSYFPPEPRP